MDDKRFEQLIETINKLDSHLDKMLDNIEARVAKSKEEEKKRREDLDELFKNLDRCVQSDQQ